MNAPAKITPLSTLPFGMIEYGPGDFDRMHAAGSMLASASGVPALFNLIPSRFGKLAYGMHLTGERPFPDISGETHIRLGHLLEPFVADLLSEELDAKVTKLNGYAMHEFLPLFSTPDGVVTIDDVETMVEIKSVGSKVFYEDWKHGPPVHVGLQHQVQFATTGAEAGIIAVFDRNYCKLEWYPTTPHLLTIEKIELNVHTFMSALERGEYPAPDDGDADFEAFRQIMWKSDPEKTIQIDGDEAERRALQFLQAKLDESAASKTIEAHKRWFQRIMGDAQVAKVEGVSVEWKTNKSTPRGQHRPARVFKIKSVNGDDDG